MPIDPSLTAQGFCYLLVKSRLVPQDEVRALYRAWRTESVVREDDPDAFRKFLVARGTVTEYQSQLLFRGNTEGYFLGPYTVVDMIGKGRMAGVYKATHKSGQIVAIKVLSASKAREPGMLARFEREGRLLMSLDHPNIVRAFEVGSEDRKHYFVMEVLDGETLAEILARRKRLSVPEAIGITSQILAGLAAMDARSLIHRDIKPANLMLVPPPGSSLRETTLQSTIKILDIGLGREILDAYPPTANTELTGENVLLGTPDYLAPEQARDARTADIRADIYSVGCVFYEMLSGQPPFPDTNLINQLVRHSQEQPTPLRELVPGIPEGLQRVVDFMLAKDPSRRYATPAKAAQGLRIFLENVPQAAPRPAPLPEYIEWLSTSQPVAIVPTAIAAATILPPPSFVQSAKIPGATFQRPPVLETLDDVDLPYAPAPKPASGSKPWAALPAKAILPPPPMPAPTTDEDDYEVVNVAPPTRPTVSAPIAIAVAPPSKAPAADDEEDERRGLFDPDRRDFIMFGAGAASVLFAILTGYGLASIAKEKPVVPQFEAKESDAEGQ